MATFINAELNKQRKTMKTMNVLVPMIPYFKFAPSRYDSGKKVLSSIHIFKKEK